MSRTSWTLTARISAPSAPLDVLVAILDALDSAEPAGSLTSDGITVRFTVVATKTEEAFTDGVARLREAAESTSLAGAPLESAGVARSDAELAPLSAQDVALAGVDEVAELLDLSRSQVLELSESPRFPEPITHLAQGPVWSRGRVERYVERLEAMSN